MEFATLLLNLLAAGSALPLSPGGRAAFDALAARLETEHDVETLSLLPRAAAEPGVRQSILSELVDPQIGRDPAVAIQAELLRAALETLPEARLLPYGLGTEALRAGRAILAARVEGSIGGDWIEDTPPEG